MDLISNLNEGIVQWSFQSIEGGQCIVFITPSEYPSNYYCVYYIRRLLYALYVTLVILRFQEILNIPRLLTM